MNRLTQHIPSSVDYREAPPSATFTTYEELLAIPFVKQWADDKSYGSFAQSDEHLMAVSPSGDKWFVVGYLLSAVDWLPIWQPGKPATNPAMGQ